MNELSEMGQTRETCIYRSGGLVQKKHVFIS